MNLKALKQQRWDELKESNQLVLPIMAFAQAANLAFSEVEGFLQSAFDQGFEAGLCEERDTEIENLVESLTEDAA